MDTSYYIDTRASKILREKEKKVNKADKIIAYIMQQLSLIGESFGWQIGRIGANYENGYMKSNQDCKTHFRKEKIKKDIEAIINDHSGEVNGMVVTNADRIRSMTDEELAKFLDKSDSCLIPIGCRDVEISCEVCYLNWLKEKVE